MIKNKKALIGKIFLFLGILILIILAIAGITIWQVYDIVKTAKQEAPIINQNNLELQQGNCSKIDEIEASTGKVIAKIEVACKNPIIRYGLRQAQNLTIDCEKMDSLYDDMDDSLELNRKVCEFKENIENKTIEDFLELQKEIEEFKNRTQQ